MGGFTGLGTMIAPGWGTAIGAAADIGMGLLGSSDDSYRTTRERMRKTIKGEQERRSGLAASQYSNLQKMVGSYDKARGEVADLGRTGRQQILDQQTRAQGAIEGGNIFHGMNASTVAQQARRGLSYDTSQALAGLQAQLAPIFSNLQLGKGQAYGALGNFFQQQSEGNKDIFQAKMNVWENYG